MAYDDLGKKELAAKAAELQGKLREYAADERTLHVGTTIGGGFVGGGAVRVMEQMIMTPSGDNDPVPAAVTTVVLMIAASVIPASKKTKALRDGVTSAAAGSAAVLGYKVSSYVV